MAYLIKSQSCLTAWKDACNHILTNGDGDNLIVEINSPGNFSEAELKEITNSGLISTTQIDNVVNTIFPEKFYRRNLGLTANQLYDLHEKIYGRGKTMHRKNKARWGNYFLRFTKFGMSKENQLQNIINDINKRKNKYAACYIMHVSSVQLDSNTRNIGNPCLQYVQIGQNGNVLNLTAIYRNHDFLNKSLGNYIGLTKLLGFICTQTGHVMGGLTCHSIHYFLEQKGKVKDCINNLTW